LVVPGAFGALSARRAFDGRTRIHRLIDGRLCRRLIDGRGWNSIRDRGFDVYRRWGHRGRGVRFTDERRRVVLQEPERKRRSLHEHERNECAGQGQRGEADLEYATPPLEEREATHPVARRFIEQLLVEGDAVIVTIADVDRIASASGATPYVLPLERKEVERIVLIRRARRT